eukprot:TRINITY_DN1485_c0_g1_i5.p1 TRINITY_DN1485_c0_g1~~TRINITY_DN1485_c0_g1_i5.p1  ORF type:complete len:161 (-),score=38.17 TRINITY_DN1485_c0_g1_i5:673-1155(-)
MMFFFSVITESGAFSPRPPSKPNKLLLLAVALLAGKICYDAVDFYRDYKTMTDKDRTKVDVWNSVGNEICSSLGDNSEVQNALGQNITFFDVISEQTHQRNEWFGGYKILSILATREMRLPVKGDSGVGVLVIVASMQGGEWKKKKVYLETSQACIPLNE